MRICFFAPANSAHIVKWCGYFASKGHEVHVVSFVAGTIDGVQIHLVESGTGAEAGDLDKLKYLLQARNVKKVIWAITGSSKFNSEAALQLREGFRSGKIRLLIPDEDFEMMMADKAGFATLPVQDRLAFKLPYINTTLLINELINLQHDDSSGLVRIIFGVTKS